MAVRIRLTRMGRKHRAFYRLGAFDARSQRDGRCIENLGTYDPVAGDGGVQINEERVRYWISVGAKPTETVRSLLKKKGLL